MISPPLTSVFSSIMRRQAGKPRPLTVMLSLIALVFWPSSGPAQTVPHLLNFQGSVGVGPASFEGTGRFKFALVNGDGSETFWSHDGSSTAGAEPTQALELPVSHGFYSLLLGDTAISGMSAIPTGAFLHPDVRLRVWFDDGIHGSQRLQPDQRIATVGYAVMAQTVPDGSVTAAKIAPGSISSTHLADGAIGAAQLASGAIQTQHLTTGAVTTEKLGSQAVTAAQLAPDAAKANLAASGQTGITSGGIIMSDQADNAALTAVGYQRMPYDIKVETDLWSDMIPTVSLARNHSKVVWTGSQMIIWGGGNAYPYTTRGGIYDEATDTWTATSTVGAPSGREGHTAVWTGTEMIVYGDGSGLKTGGRYEPATDTWTALPTTDAPSSGLHVAVWTGSEMIVWRGTNKEGARYNPISNAWTTISSTNAPSTVTPAIWTGSEMIVWGGGSDSGARYNPTTDTWTPMSPSGHPTAFTEPKMIWTGTEMIAGGRGYVRYNPATDVWTPVSTKGMASNRSNHSLVWTGKEMIVCGGTWGVSAVADTGCVYDPVKDAWRAMDSTRADGVGWGYQGVWTRKHALFWAGGNSSITFNLSSFVPARHLYLYQKP